MITYSSCRQQNNQMIRLRMHNIVTYGYAYSKLRLLIASDSAGKSS
ncbi:MAG: hypothetical protein LBF62_11255 [Tannerellaceae bacterium]|nr:hypothetical protein [Tannerellaceae bacterium]